LLLALLARGGFLLANGPSRGGDTADYLTIARNLVQEGAFSLEEVGPFSPTIRRPPLYPFFLAGVGRIGGLSEWTVSTTQVALDAVTAVMVLHLARMVVATRWATAVAIAYGLFPGAIAISSTILSETLFTFVLVASVLVLTLGIQRNRLALTTAGGAGLGLAILCRPVALLYLVMLMLALLGFGPCLAGSRKYAPSTRKLFHVGLLLVGAVAVVAPWLVRCSLVSGQFVFVQGTAAINWYIPTLVELDQGDERTLWPYFVNEDPYGKLLGEARTPAETLEADRFGFHQALSNVRARPTDYLVSRLRSFPHLFINSFDSFTHTNQSFGTLWACQNLPGLFLKLGLLTVFSITPILLAVAGLGYSRRSVGALFCATLWLTTLIAHLPMWIEFRFWLPVVPFLFISAGVTLASWQSRLCRWGGTGT
jgi:4-amino-4-deoxy-L-arabinose transferase-like glycosyltransferase